MFAPTYCRRRRPPLVPFLLCWTAFWAHPSWSFVAPSSSSTYYAPVIPTNPRPYGTGGRFYYPSSSLNRIILHAEQPSKSNSNNNKSSSNNKTSSTKKTTGSAGVYVRPSGAIERGSGFFVPGLEGSRVRLVFGGVLVLLTAINHFLTTVAVEVVAETGTTTATTATASLSSTSSFELPEVVAILYALLVLFQAAIEFFKEQGGGLVGGNTISLSTTEEEEATTTTTTTDIDASSVVSRKPSSIATATITTNQWSLPAAQLLSEKQKDKVQWAAASYLALTSATHIMVLEKDFIVYRQGTTTTTTTSISQEEISRGTTAALDALQSSKSGRLSLPASHPTTQALFAVPAGMGEQPQNNLVRAVIIQRITPTKCWLVASDQLVASFTPADLKWLGQLATYVVVE
jgi:hypothetical protein